MKKERKNRVSKSKCLKKWENLKNKFTKKQIDIGTTVGEAVYFIILAKCIYDAKDINKQTLGILTCLGILGGLLIFYIIEYCIFDIHNSDNENKDYDEDEEDEYDKN